LHGAAQPFRAADDGAPVAPVVWMLPKRPRLKTFDYVGRHRYFLTFCTHLRAPILVTAERVDLVLSQIRRTAVEHEFAVIAYVFMADHTHWLVQGLSDRADLRAWVSLAKQKSGHAYSRAHEARLWQPSFHDRVLRDEEGSLPVMAYIFNNPVQEGLVERWEDYPFLGSDTMQREEIRAALREVAPWQYD
jgi:REP element-mobilizing transposase RayT